MKRGSTILRHQKRMQKIRKALDDRLLRDMGVVVDSKPEKRLRRNPGSEWKGEGKGPRE